MKKTELLNHAHKMLKDAGVPDFEESARRLLILATGIKDSDYFSLSCTVSLIISSSSCSTILTA